LDNTPGADFKVRVMEVTGGTPSKPNIGMNIEIKFQVETGEFFPE
jgi:hypothetical protein